MIFNGIFTRIMSIDEIKRQSIATFSSQIVLTFVGFLSTMYFAHAVGSSILGAYFLFTAYFGIINLISDGGFGAAAVKRISEGEEPNAYFTAFFVTRVFFTVMVVGVIFAARSYFEMNEQIFNWLILALIVSLFHSIVSKGVAGCSKMGIVAVGAITQNISRISIQIIAVFLGFEIAGLAGGFVAGFVAAAIIQFKFFDLKLTRFRWGHISNLTSFSFWLFMTSAGIMLYSYADVIMIGYFLEESDVGVYQVVFQFTGIAILFATSIRTTLWPKVSRWGKTGDMNSTEKALSRGLTFSLLLAIPTVVGGTLLGENMLYFFYGPGFAWGYTTLVILFCAQMVNIFQIFFLMCLGALDYQRNAFYVTATSSITNVVLNLVLIPFMGIEGAAIATAITMALNALISMYILSKIIRIRVEIRSILNILKATTAMSVFVVFYKYIFTLTNVWITLVPVIIGSVIYIFLILRLDPRIYKDLKDISTRMNLPWPRML